MGNTLLIATRKGLLQYTRNNQQWQFERLSFAGEPISQVLADPRDNTLYAALNLGHFGPHLHRSRDGGVSWQEVAAPAFPKIEGDEADKSAPSVAQIFCLEAGHQPGELWAGTVSCGLFHSTDSGDSWTLLPDLTDMESSKHWMGGGNERPALHSILLDPARPALIRVAISVGGIWESLDSGQTWTGITQGMKADYLPPDMADMTDGQDPHLMVACPADQERLWVQHHCGIFHSRNGGKQWERITEAGPSTFGFAVAVHPAEPDTAWFVPGIKDQYRMPVDQRLVVTRTRDGGNSFEVLEQGLPREGSFDLIYRHALAIAPYGQQLAMGSTTGNLWVTADQGDNWQLLSHTLAPVYCVKFA